MSIFSSKEVQEILVRHDNTIAVGIFLIGLAFVTWTAYFFDMI